MLTADEGLHKNKMPQTFTLHVTVSGGDDELLKERDTCFIAYPSSCHISQSSSHQDAAQYALLFVPATIVDSSLEQFHHDISPYNRLDEYDKQMLSDRLLHMIHPFLARNLPLKAVIPVRHEHAPADLVLLDLSHTPADAVLDLLEQCHMLHSGPELVLKALLIDHVDLHAVGQVPSTQQQQFHIPMCPVCLHRIDPPRLGFQLPSSELCCSRFCPPPDLLSGTRNSNNNHACPKQRLLEPWPRPSCCATCRVIQTYWSSSHNSNTSTDVRCCCCMACGMQETLWVCLTCAFVGCGRYSNKHAAQHFRDSAHPFCLELTTLRIWDYSYGEGGFAHRVDLLECPSSPPLWSPWVHAASGADRGVFAEQQDNDFNGPNSFHYFDTTNEKAPKKTTMISEEYEALLQSALEEQAQHYEGEISRLRAELMATVVSRDTLSDVEQAELDHIAASNEALKANIEAAKHSILELQAQEAPLRTASNQLLREQQTAKDLLQSIQEENRTERHAGNVQVDELEQQIADLTTNQRMREQFIQDEELQNAQIFGTTGNEQAKKAGKKTRRFFRK